MASNVTLSDKEKLEFIRNGFLVLRAAISPQLVSDAVAVIDNAYQHGEYGPGPRNGDVLKFNSSATGHASVARLLEVDRVFTAMEDLLGSGNVQMGRRGQIALRGKDQAAIDSGVGVRDDMPRKGYHIDGGTQSLSGTGTPFTMLVGVCLSPGQQIDENRGQFTVWPGSHMKLHPIVRERWEEGLIDGKTVFGGPKVKPDIGPPKRVLMNPGDVVLVHQRLGHSGGVNVHSETRKNVYFRVKHKQFDRLLEPLLKGSVFTHFEGLHHLLPSNEYYERTD